MTATDIVLILLLGGGFLVGFFQGMVRGLLAIGAWAVAFVLGANLRDPLGSYLASQWANLTAGYVAMLAFAIAAVALFVILLVLIHIGTRGPMGVTSKPMLDDLIGGVLGVLLVVLVIAAAITVLGTFYGTAPTASEDELGVTGQLYRALAGSGVARAIGDSVVPLLGTLLGAFVPQSVRDAMA